MEHDPEPRNKYTLYGHWYSKRVTRTHKREMIVPSINGVGKTGYPLDIQIESFSHTMYKNQFKINT